MRAVACGLSRQNSSRAERNPPPTLNLAPQQNLLLDRWQQSVDNGDSNQLSWFSKSQPILGCACERAFHTKSHISCWKPNHRGPRNLPRDTNYCQLPPLLLPLYSRTAADIAASSHCEPIVLMLDFRGPSQRYFTATATTSVHHFMQSVMSRCSWTSL